MKKFFAMLLVVTMIASMATVVSAADTTTLTTTVPSATYTLNIPSNQVIPFGSESTTIGNVTVTDSSGFAYGKNLEVTATWEDFACDSASTTIPFKLCLIDPGNCTDLVTSGVALVFEGKSDTTVYETARSMDGVYFIDEIAVIIWSNDWSKALAGEYTATITFTCEVVVEQ